MIWLLVLYPIIAALVYYFFYVYNVVSDGFLAGLTGIFWPIMVPVVLLTNFAQNRKIERQERKRFQQYLSLYVAKEYKYRIDLFDHKRGYFELTGPELLEALEWADTRKKFNQDFKTLVK